MPGEATGWRSTRREGTARRDSASREAPRGRPVRRGRRGGGGADGGQGCHAEQRRGEGRQAVAGSVELDYVGLAY